MLFPASGVSVLNINAPRFSLVSQRRDPKTATDSSDVGNMAPTGTNSTGDFTSEILQALSKADPVLSAEAFPQVPFEPIKAALDRLASRHMVTYEQVEREEAFLEPEAEVIVSHGSHEARVFEAVRKALDGLSIQELENEIGDKTVTKLGQGKAFKEKWIKKDGAKLVAVVRLPFCHACGVSTADSFGRLIPSTT